LIPENSGDAKLDISKKSSRKKQARSRHGRNLKSISRASVSDKTNQTKRLLTSAEWEIILSLREYARCHPLARKKAA